MSLSDDEVVINWDSETGDFKLENRLAVKGKPAYLVKHEDHVARQYRKYRESVDNDKVLSREEDRKTGTGVGVDVKAYRNREFDPSKVYASYSKTRSNSAGKAEPKPSEKKPLALLFPETRDFDATSIYADYPVAKKSKDGSDHKDKKPHTSQVWFTEEAASLCKKKQRLYKQYKQTGMKFYHEKYLKFKKKTQNRLRQLRSYYVANELFDAFTRAGNDSISQAVSIYYQANAGHYQLKISVHSYTKH